MLDFVDIAKIVREEMLSDKEEECLTPVKCVHDHFVCFGFVVDEETDLAKIVAKIFATAVKVTPVQDLDWIISKFEVALSFPKRMGNIVKFPRISWGPE